MRKYLYFIAFYTGLVIQNSYGQDLIVTNVGDSIACKIVRETPTIVQFSYTKYNQNIIREFGKDRIRAIVIDFYKDKYPSEVPAVTQNATVNPTEEDSTKTSVLAEKNESAESNTKNRDTTHWAKWQFGLNGGYAYRLFRPRVKATPYELKYIEKVKQGFSIGADLFYFPWKHVGFGVKYDLYRSKASRDIRTADNITIQFFGGSVAYRKFFTNPKTSIISALWMGYQPYKNVARHLGEDYTMKANTMGWGISVGIEQRITPKMAVTLTGNCMMGSIYKFKKDRQGRMEAVKFSYHAFEDLSRASINLGFKFLK